MVMELFELIQLFSISGQKLDALWQFFVTVHLAIFGALFVFHKMKKHQIVISIISYFTFSLINLRAKIQEYLFYESIIDAIKKVDKKSISSIDSYFSQYNVDDRIIITIIIHFVSLLFLLYLLKKSKVS